MVLGRVLGVATVIAGGWAVACADDGGAAAAVCDPLEAVVRPAVGLGEESPTLGAVLVHADRVAEGELVAVVAYLAPDAADRLPELVAIAEDAVGADAVEAFDQQAAFVEYEELFAEDSPELVGAVDPSDLPPSVRVVTDDAGAVDELLDTLERLVTVYRAVDSRDEPVTDRIIPVRSDASRSALFELAVQDDDPAVATAADVLRTPPEEWDPEDGTEEEIRDELLAALHTVAGAAEDC